VIKIKVGTLTLTEARDVDLPQEFAAWHQTVRIEPGTYDVFAYLDYEGDGYRVTGLAAEAEGVTISSNFRSHMLGQWGKSDNNRNGQRATAHIRLPTYGVVADAAPSLLDQATLCDALVRSEWDSAVGAMWRLAWKSDQKILVIEAPRYGGGLAIAAFDDTRRFAVDGVEMSPEDAHKLDLHFSHGFRLDNFSVGEVLSGYCFREQKSREVARIA